MSSRDRKIVASSAGGRRIVQHASTDPNVLKSVASSAGARRIVHLMCVLPRTSPMISRFQERCIIGRWPQDRATKLGPAPHVESVAIASDGFARAGSPYQTHSELSRGIHTLPQNLVCGTSQRFRRNNSFSHFTVYPLAFVRHPNMDDAETQTIYVLF